MLIGHFMKNSGAHLPLPGGIQKNWNGTVKISTTCCPTKSPVTIKFSVRAVLVLPETKKAVIDVSWATFQRATPHAVWLCATCAQLDIIGNSALFASIKDPTNPRSLYIALSGSFLRRISCRLSGEPEFSG